MNPVENKMNTEMNYDDQLLTLELEEKRIAKMKSELMIKKYMSDQNFQQTFLTNIKARIIKDKEDYKSDINIYRDRITDLEKGIADYEAKIDKLETDDESANDKIEQIEGINFEEDDVETYIAENFQEEAIEYIEKLNKLKTPAKKSVAKKVIDNDDISSISSNDSKKRKPEKYDRDTQFSEMPTDMEMFIQYKGHKETFIKIEDGVRAEDGLIHRNLNQAGRAFYASIGADKVSFNAWAEFKVMVNGKKVAVGDL
jgi:hypothetical protein